MALENCYSVPPLYSFFSNKLKVAGYHSIEFNASDLPSGVYFYRLQSGNFIDTKKMILLK